MSLHSIDVLRKLIQYLRLEKHSFHLLEHVVCMNWRQKYPAPQHKLENLDEALRHDGPRKSWFFDGAALLDAAFDPSELVTGSGCVLSVSSRVSTPDGGSLHIPMMNFHPVDTVTLIDIRRVLAAICGAQRGYVLATGRYWHYWGEWLLSETEWVRFNCQFLMPTVVVSERYIAHSLHRGYNALRLTASSPQKPVLPYVIECIERP